jgi:hypothetical protein
MLHAVRVGQQRNSEMLDLPEARKNGPYFAPSKEMEYHAVFNRTIAQM